MQKLRELCQRNEDRTIKNNKNNLKFEIGQLGMVKTHAHHTFEYIY